MNTEKLVQPGRIVFAVGIFALGVLCFGAQDFIVGRPPAWPASLSLNPALAYASGGLLIIASFLILLRKYEEYAALVIAALILSLSVLRHMPQFMNDWGNAYKSLALTGGALIVAGSGTVFRTAIRNAFINIGAFSFTSFFLMGAYAHFRYADFVKGLIPAFIPFPLIWTYFAGACLLAGGIGLLLPGFRKRAAFLCGVMIAGWFVLIHIPRVLLNVGDLSERMGLCESFTFVGMMFVLSGMVIGRK